MFLLVLAQVTILPLLMQKQLVLEFINDALMTVSGDFPAPADFAQGL